MNNINDKLAVAEIIAIGNELLIGKTVDTNTNWLAKRLTDLGVYVKRAIVVRDIIEDIVEAVDSTMESATLIITTGGLGPTEDDLTLKAISKVVSQELELNKQALEMVKQQYNYFYQQGFVDSIELTSARKKMAILPKDSIPVFNRVGAAPGVIINHKNIILFILPGVPKEMEAIFNNGIGDIVTKIGKLENTQMKEIITDIGDESKLAPILKSIQEKVEGVLLKSIASHFGKDVKMKIRIMVYGGTEEERRNKIITVEMLLEEKYNIKSSEHI